MTLRRRDLLHAVAASPSLLLAPALIATPRAGAVVPIDGRVDSRDLAGIALSWDRALDTPAGVVRARVDGDWTEPIVVVGDHGHGPEDPSGRIFSQPILVPGADLMEIEAHHLRAIQDLRIHPLPAERLLGHHVPLVLTTTEPAPGLSIVERRNWTGRGRRDTGDCVLGSSVFGLGCRSDVGTRHAIVHHTVNVNDYSESDVPTLLQGIQRYHMDTRGWDDIAYNFVIDRFGRIWHARSGDLDQPITGGHTTGLNAESIGVAILGTFTDTDPGQPVVDALVSLLGWKLARHGVDPLGWTDVKSTGGDFAEAGETVTLRNISPHRDNQQTSCPGDGVAGRLDEVRAAAAELVPIFGSVVPGYEPAEVQLQGWAIDRFDPGGAVTIDITVDDASTVLDAVAERADVATQYPEAGAAHGFEHVAPIDLDTRSITVTASAADGRSALLMDLRLFATFIDVEPHRFFADGVYFLRQTELSHGKQPGLFEPMDELSRAEMATFLHRFMGTPTPERPARFEDTVSDAFYTEAVDWMASARITTGTSPTTFAPDELVTRAQMATFIWRLCGSPDPVGHTRFVDVPADAYFARAVTWMADLGITTGVSPTRFAPLKTVTRGETATFLHRLASTPAAWSMVTPPTVVTF